MIEEVIGECLFLFIKGQHILDCVLVANKVVDLVRKLGKNDCFSKLILKGHTTKSIRVFSIWCNKKWVSRLDEELGLHSVFQMLMSLFS